ncbi:MAG TPA: hypothetical protein VLG47_04805 [Candidatus Saccharimonadales bacterium]|nr:hypothetical protein [Candidatus Saccharimonadales bacterium]
MRHLTQARTAKSNHHSKIHRQKHEPHYYQHTLPLIAAFVLVAGLGMYFLSSGKAATIATSSETESGSVTGNTSNVTDSNASGGRAIKFGTGGSSGGQLCTNPIFTSSAVQGRYPSTGADYVNNNVWNTTEAGPQTIFVCSQKSFYVNSNQPDLANDRGSIKSYPAVCGCGFGDAKQIGQYTNITSTFGESIPHMGEWDAGYDMWTDNWTNEIMIQNDVYNHPPQDGTPITIDGIAMHALQVDPSFLVFGYDNFKASGSVNILHVFQWAIAHGWMKSTDTLTAIGYGVEISYTESSPGVKGQERFDITDYSVTAN